MHRTHFSRVEDFYHQGCLNGYVSDFKIILGFWLYVYLIEHRAKTMEELL